MTVQLVPSAAFEFVTDRVFAYRVMCSRHRFRESLLRLLGVMDVSYEGNYPTHAFADFKKHFTEQKERIENNEAFAENLGWDNFVTLMCNVSFKMPSSDYCGVGIDAMFAHGLDHFSDELRSVWESIPHDHQVIIAQEGVFLNKYAPLVQCHDLVMALDKSDNLKSLWGDIWNEACENSAHNVTRQHTGLNR